MSDDIFLSPKDRTRHVYIPGKTQSGKSSLIAHQILADIYFGRGVCVMDAKTKLASTVAQWIPERRIEDSIYFGQDVSVPIDFMGYRGDIEREQIIDEITFLYSHTTHTDHMPTLRSNLDNIIHALLNYNDNPVIPPMRRATFLDIYYFLMDPLRREEIICGMTNRDLALYWQDEKNLPKGENLFRLVSRMTPFKNSPVLCAMFDVPNPKLNIAQAIQERKILLVELGMLTMTRRTFATLLLSKIRQAFDRNTGKPDDEMVPFYVYCDEFQQFQTSDFADMLARAGGLNLCLTLVNQSPTQLTTPGLWDAIRTNVGTKILFQLDYQEATRFVPYFPKVQRYEHQQEYDFLQKKRHELESSWASEKQSFYNSNETWGDFLKDSPLRKIQAEHKHVLERLARIGEPFPDTLDYLAELIRLPEGQAVYIPRKGEAIKVGTPEPLPDQNPNNFLDRIRDNTKRYFARTVNRSPDASAKYAQRARSYGGALNSGSGVKGTGITAAGEAGPHPHIMGSYAESAKKLPFHSREKNKSGAPG